MTSDTTRTPRLLSSSKPSAKTFVPLARRQAEVVRLSEKVAPNFVILKMWIRVKMKIGAIWNKEVVSVKKGTNNQSKNFSIFFFGFFLKSKRTKLSCKMTVLFVFE